MEIQFKEFFLIYEISSSFDRWTSAINVFFFRVSMRYMVVSIY